eukprot:1142870-Karenia_brevis.AAC.1
MTQATQYRKGGDEFRASGLTQHAALTEYTLCCYTSSTQHDEQGNAFRASRPARNERVRKHEDECKI